MSCDIVWPLGCSVVEGVPEKQFSDSLDGKTIAFMWDYLFRGPEMFAAIQQEIQRQYQDVRFVDYERFGNIHGAGPDQANNLEAVPEVLRTERVDLVVTAVGA